MSINPHDLTKLTFCEFRSLAITSLSFILYTFSMNYFRAPVLLSLFLTFASVVQAIPSVQRFGRYLYTNEGTTRFYIKGIAYQNQGYSCFHYLRSLTLKCVFLGFVTTTVNNPFLQPTTFIDSLANLSTCQRDLTFLQQLTVNTIRVYSVNSSLNHDGCMNLFSQNGIYTM